MSQDLKTEQNGELDFAKMYEESLKSIAPGEKIKGKVISISSKNNDVFVDLGYKADGVIPFNEFSYDVEQIPSKVLKAGDDVECLVLKINDGEGNVLLSRKRLEDEKMLDVLEKAYEDGTVVKGIVEKVVNGGVIANVKSVKVFVPASQLGDKKVDNLEDFLKKSVDLKIINFDKEKKKIVGSQREVLKKLKNEEREKLWESLTVGQTVKGVVKSITDFGAFIDIGGQDGMVHISELAWRKVKHPSELLTVGQDVFMTIIGLDKEKGKVSLSYKDPDGDPWKKVVEVYNVGDVVKGKVVEMMPFGAFIELEDGVVGLVHISQISRKRINHPQEVLKMGELVEAKIVEIDPDKKKVGLSIKEILPIEELEEIVNKEKVVEEESEATDAK